MPRALLLVCLGSTLFMTGLIWFVQVIHYPLFEKVAATAFVPYHEAHTRLTSRLVVIPMLLELLSSAALVAIRPRLFPTWVAWTCLAVCGGCWLLTALVQVPQHDQLARGFNLLVWRRLVATNWARTWLWTVHAVLLIVVVARELPRD